MREPDGSKTKLDSSKKFSIFKNSFSELFAELEQSIVPLLPDVAWSDVSSKLVFFLMMLLF